MLQKGRAEGEGLVLCRSGAPVCMGSCGMLSSSPIESPMLEEVWKQGGFEACLVKSD